MKPTQAPKPRRRRPPVDPQHWEFLEKIYADYKEMNVQQKEITDRKRSLEIELFHGNAEEINRVLLGDAPADHSRFGDWETYERVEHILKKFVYCRTQSLKQASELETVLKERVNVLTGVCGNQEQRITSLEAALAAVQNELAGTMDLLYMKEKEATALKSECLVKSLKAAQLQRVCNSLQGSSKIDESAICKDMRILIEVNKKIEQENRRLRIALKTKKTSRPSRVNSDVKTGKERARSEKAKTSKPTTVTTVASEHQEKSDADIFASSISGEGGEVMTTGTTMEMEHHASWDSEDDDDPAMTTVKTPTASVASTHTLPFSKKTMVAITGAEDVKSPKGSLNGSMVPQRRGVVGLPRHLEGDDVRNTTRYNMPSEESSDSDWETDDVEVSDHKIASILVDKSERKRFLVENAPITALHMRLLEEREAWQRRLEAEVTTSLSLQDHDANLCRLTELRASCLGSFTPCSHLDDLHIFGLSDGEFRHRNSSRFSCDENAVLNKEEVENREYGGSILVATKKGIAASDGRPSSSVASEERKKSLKCCISLEEGDYDKQMQDENVVCDSELGDTPLPSRVLGTILVHQAVGDDHQVFEEVGRKFSHGREFATSLLGNVVAPSEDELKTQNAIHQSSHNSPRTANLADEIHTEGRLLKGETNSAASHSCAVRYTGFQGIFSALKEAVSSLGDEHRTLRREMDEQFRLVLLSLNMFQEQMDYIWHGIESEGHQFASSIKEDIVNDMVERRVFELLEGHDIALQRHPGHPSALADGEWMQNQLHDIILESVRGSVAEAILEGGGGVVQMKRNRARLGPRRSSLHQHHQTAEEQEQLKKQQQREGEGQQRNGQQRHGQQHTSRRREVHIREISPAEGKQSVTGRTGERDPSALVKRERLLKFFEKDVEVMLARQKGRWEGANVCNEYEEMPRIDELGQVVRVEGVGLGGPSANRGKGAAGEEGVVRGFPSVSARFGVPGGIFSRVAVRKRLIPCGVVNMMDFIDDQGLSVRRCAGLGAISGTKCFEGNILEYLKKIRPCEKPSDVSKMAPVVYRYDFQALLNDMKVDVRRDVRLSDNYLKGSEFKDVFDSVVLPFARAFNKLNSKGPLPLWILQAIHKLRVEEEKRNKLKRKLLLQRIAINLRAKRLLRSHLCRGSALASFVIVLGEKWTERWKEKLTSLKRERYAGIQQILELMTAGAGTQPRLQEGRTLGSVRNPLWDPSSAHFSKVQLPQTKK